VVTAFTSNRSRLMTKGGAMPVNEADLEALLDRSASAETLHVSVSTLDRLVRKGEIEVIRVGGKVLITRRALLDYLNRNSGRAAV